MPDPIRTLVLAENMFLAPFLALKIIFHAKISKMLDFGSAMVMKNERKKNSEKSFFFMKK